MTNKPTHVAWRSRKSGEICDCSPHERSPHANSDPVYVGVEPLINAVRQLLALRSEILPDDDPKIWREPLFGAIDSLRAYVGQEGGGAASGVPAPESDGS